MNESDLADSGVQKVVNMCPCSANADGGQARHGKDKTCNVHQWVAALDHEDDPDALYLVSQGPCACGYAWPGCAYPLHAVALDALAECLEKAGQHLSAFSTALSIIRLNPISSVVSFVWTRRQNHREARNH